MEHETVTVLCSDWGCKHNGGGGYYGVCHHPGAQNQLPYGGITRTYQSTCNVREPNKIPVDPSPITKEEMELLGRTPIEI